MNETQLSLCFLKVAGSHRNKFVVEVTHGDRLVTAFDMVKDDGEGWKILPPVREWVLYQSDKLAGLANRSLNEQTMRS